MKDGPIILVLLAIIIILIGLVGFLVFFVGFNMMDNGMMGNQDNSGMMGDVDRHFMEQMIPHHESAIDMANIASTKAEHQEIKQLAENIKRDRSFKIEKYMVPLADNQPFDRDEVVKVVCKDDFDKIKGIVQGLKEEREQLKKQVNELTILSETHWTYINTIEKVKDSKNKSILISLSFKWIKQVLGLTGG